MTILPPIDLTLPLPEETITREELTITQADDISYQGVIHHFSYGSMVGTYIDFPSHITATDDGTEASSFPLNRLYRQQAAIIHLDRTSYSGAVEAEELAKACMIRQPVAALIINALGESRFDEIKMRSVWLASSALDWIIEHCDHLLVSDIYESPAPHGVFTKLFTAGICTICNPVNLHLLSTSQAILTALPLRVSGATQIPCRLLAEPIEEKKEQT